MDSGRCDMLKPCETWAERLSAYLDGELPSTEQAMVEDHLRTCAACRAYAELTRCDAQDAAAALQPRGATDAFAARVMQAVGNTTMDDAPATDRYVEMVPELPVKKARFRFLEWLVVGATMALVATVLFPIFARPREKARQTQCQSNQRQIAAAIQMWCQDHDEQLPNAATWLHDIQVDAGVLIDPTVGRGLPVAYAYNQKVSNVSLGKLDNPSTAMLTFDARNGMPDYRHNNCMLASYADGHVAPVRKPGAYPETAMTPPSAAEEKRMLKGLTRYAQVDTETLSLRPKPPTIAPPVKNYGLADKLQIAYKVAVGLESKDVQGSLEQAELLFRHYDGFVLTSDFNAGDQNTPATATVNGRVPSEQLGMMLVELDKLGKLKTRTVNGEDLTAQHFTNQETLGNLTGAQGKLEGIGATAKTASGKLNVEDQREDKASAASGARVDEYKLKSRVTLAEVTVTITAAPAPPPPAAPTVSPLRQSLEGSTKALGGFLNWLLTCLVIPAGVFLPIWGPVLGIAVLVWRKRRVR